MTKITEMSFFKKVITSIKDFERYTEMATQKVTETSKYILKLIAIITLIIVVAYTYKNYKAIINTRELIEEEMPEFTIEENNLKIDIEEPIIIQRDNLLFGSFIIDGSNEVNNEQLEIYKNKLREKNTGIILLKDKIIALINLPVYATIIDSTDLSMDIKEYSYQEILENRTSINKQNVIDAISDGIVFIIILSVIVNFIYLYMINIISVLISILLLTMLGYITGRILKVSVKISAMFNMVVHAFTLPTILLLIYVIVNMFNGLKIIYFDAMYMGVAYIYIVSAILMIKSDLIKRQQELVKIIEEQRKVAEEQKRRDEEEEQREKDKEEKKQEDENDEKEDSEDGEHRDGELGGTNPTPQGNMFNEDNSIEN